MTSFIAQKVQMIPCYLPIPELRSTPHANQIAAVKFNESSSRTSPESVLYRPKGENRSSRYKQTAITLR